MKYLFSVLVICLAPSMAMALTISPTDLQNELNGAELEVELNITTWQTLSDPIHYATFQAEATINAVLSSKGDNVPAVGDSVTIEGLGGERNGVGVVIPGYPRPLVGHRYHAYLNRNPSNSNFVVAGLEHGLVDLDSNHLYTRNRTDGSNGEGVGPFLYWASNFIPVPYYISAPSFAGHPDFIAAIDQSFKTWRNIPDITMEFIPMGCTTKVFDQNDGINTVIFVTENWQFDPAIIALTRNFYVAGDSPEPGLMLTTDIMINGANQTFSTTGDPNSFDVQDIVTHEAGHFQGLGHDTVPPIDPNATMYATATPGETKKRTLHPDDLDGIHAAYPGVGQKLGSFGFPSCELADNSGNVGCASVHKESSRSSQDLVWIAIFLVSLIATARVTFRFGNPSSTP
jgi:hypothetical protein